MNNVFNLSISIILSLIIGYDLFTSFRKNSRLKEVRYVLRNVGGTMNYAVIVLLICAMVFNFYVYRITKDEAMVYIAYWMLLLLLQSISYLTKTGGINDYGIGFSGRFYNWDKVMSYYCDKNTGRVTLAVSKELFGSKSRSRLRLQAGKTQIGEIEKLLASKIK